MSWLEYYERVGEKPNSLVVGVVREYSGRRSAALDLGAGNLRDSKFLLKKGFERVVAVDRDRVIVRFAVPGIETTVACIEDYEIEADTFNLVIACNSFYFTAPGNLEAVFKRVYRGLRSGGVFAFNLMGEEDEAIMMNWGAYGFTEDEIVKLCKGFILEGIEEDRRFARTKDGRKFWHLWSVVLRKK